MPDFTDKITNDFAEYSLDWKRQVSIGQSESWYLQNLELSQ